MDKYISRAKKYRRAQFGFEASERDGVKNNPDGSHSTHLMRTETIDGINWVSFPTLFQNPDGTWLDMSDEVNWKLPMMEAKRRGELIHFGPNKKEALKYGKGSWKPEEESIMQKEKTIPMLQDGEEIVFRDIITNKEAPAPNWIVDEYGNVDTDHLEGDFTRNDVKNYITENYTTVNTSNQQNALLRKLKSQPFRDRYAKNYFNITGENLSEEELTDKINQQYDWTAGGSPFHAVYPHFSHRPKTGYRAHHNPAMNPFASVDNEYVYPQWKNIGGVYYSNRNHPLYAGDTRFKGITDQLAEYHGTEDYNPNINIPEFAKYTYVPFLAKKRNPYNMENPIEFLNDWRDTVVHEYAHSYNTEDSPFFADIRLENLSGDDQKGFVTGFTNPNYQKGYSEMPGPKYKAWLTDLFGEDYFDKDINPWGTWSMKPWEISSIKAENEARMKNLGIWDHTKEAFSADKHLKGMLHKDNDLPGDASSHQLNSMGFGDLKRKKRELEKLNKDQKEKLRYYNRYKDDGTITEYIQDHIINPNTDPDEYDFFNPVMNMADFNNIFNKAQTDLKDKHKYSDYASLVEDYNAPDNILNKRKKERATNILNTINEQILKEIENNVELEDTKRQFEIKRKEVAPKLEKYFNEIAQNEEIGDDIGDPMSVKYGGSLPSFQGDEGSSEVEGDKPLYAGMLPEIALDVNKSPDWNIYYNEKVKNNPVLQGVYEGQSNFSNTVSDLPRGMREVAKDSWEELTYDDIEFGASFAPYLGEVIDAKNTIKSLYEGNYTEAGLHGLGFLLPFVPGKAVVKGYKKLFGKSDDIVKKVDDDMINPTAFDDAGNELVPTMTKDGTVQMRPKKDVVLINRVEDPATLNADTRLNYEDGNWYSTENSGFYNYFLKDASGNRLPITNDRKVFTGYMSKDAADKFHVSKSTDRAINMSGGKGTGKRVHPSELILPPELQEKVRNGEISKNELGEWLQMNIGSGEDISQILDEFYKKFGGSLPKAQDGIPENIYSTREKNLEAKNYLREYIMSPMYLERLAIEFPEVSERDLIRERDLRLKNLNSVSVSIPDTPLSNSGNYGGVLGLYTSKEHHQSPSQLEYNRKHGKRDHHIQLEPNPYYNYQAINLHEYSHAIDADGTSNKTMDLIDSITKKSEKEKKPFSYDPGIDYLRTPTEFVARLQAIRYRAFKEGLYNPMTEKFTKEHLELLKNNYDIRNDNHFKDIYNILKGDEKEQDKNLIKSMNEIAMEPTPNMDFVKKGTEVKDPFYSRRKYSTSASKYRRGGEKRLPKFQDKGQVNEYPFSKGNYGEGTPGVDYMEYKGKPLNKILPEVDIDGRGWWKKAYQDYISPTGHTVLDVLGFVPGFGEIADGVNALWYTGEGNYVDAGLSASAMIPFAGWAATLGKWGKNTYKAMDEIIDGGGDMYRQLQVLRKSNPKEAKRLGFKNDRQIKKMLQNNPEKATNIIESSIARDNSKFSRANFLDNVKIRTKKDALSGLNYQMGHHPGLRTIDPNNITSHLDRMGSTGKTTLYRFGDSYLNKVDLPGSPRSGWFSADPFDPYRYDDMRRGILDGKVFKIDLHNSLLPRNYRGIGVTSPSTHYGSHTLFKEFDIPDWMINKNKMTEFTLDDYTKYLNTLKKYGGRIK